MKSDTCTLPDRLLEHRIRGTRLSGQTLGQALEPGPTLLVFLRHFG